MKKIEKMRKENKLLYSTVFMFVISGLCSAVIGNFVPYLRESYGFSYDYAGLLISAASIGGLIAVVLSGILPLYIGRRSSIIFWSLWVVMGYGVIAAGIHVQFLLLIAFFGVGVSRGSDANFSSTMISTLPANMSRKGFLFVHSSFAIGALASPLLLVLLVRMGFSWKWMAAILCALTIIRLFFYTKMEIPPIEKTDQKKSAIEFTFLKDRYFVLGALILLFYVAVEYGISGWLVTYFQDTGILNADMAQLTNSLFWCVILIGRLTGSVLFKKMSDCRQLVIDVIGMTVFFFIMFFGKSTVSVLIGLGGVAFFMATMYPTAYSFGSTHLGGNDFGCGMLNLLPSAGGIVAPILVGLVAERGGIQKGMGFLVVLTVLLLAVIFVTAWIMRKNDLYTNNEVK